MTFWHTVLALFSALMLHTIVLEPIERYLSKRRVAQQMAEMKRWLDDQMAKNKRDHDENMRVTNESFEKQRLDAKKEHDAWVEETEQRRRDADAKHEKFMASLESCEHKSRKGDCKICNKPPMQS